MGEQYDRAIESFSKAIELNPKHAAAYTHRGCAYAMTGELDKALVDHNIKKQNRQIPKTDTGLSKI